MKYIFVALLFLSVAHDVAAQDSLELSIGAGIEYHTYADVAGSALNTNPSLYVIGSLEKSGWSAFIMKSIDLRDRTSLGNYNFLNAKYSHDFSDRFSVWTSVGMGVFEENFIPVVPATVFVQAGLKQTFGIIELELRSAALIPTESKPEVTYVGRPKITISARDWSFATNLWFSNEHVTTGVSLGSPSILLGSVSVEFGALWNCRVNWQSRDVNGIFSANMHISF